MPTSLRSNVVATLEASDQQAIRAISNLLRGGNKGLSISRC